MKNKAYSFTFLITTILISFSLLSKESTPVELTPGQLYNKAVQYENGQGVQQSFKLAIEYYELAIAKKHAPSMHNLGAIYNSGNGVKQDRSIALKLWGSASELGYHYSSYNMGNAYLSGNGREQDSNRALEFYMLSFEQGYSEAICQYASVLNEVAPFYSGSTRRLLEPLALSGNTQCLHSLVNLLFLDYENHLEPKKLLFWAELAVHQQIRDVIFLLGIIYDFGEKGVSPDPLKAKEYYLMAAELSHNSAYANLGFMYESGKFGSPDFVTAKYYYEKAIEVGSEWGFNNLASFYRSGLGKVVDYAKALELYQKSAALGNAYAHRNLGLMHRFGEGTKVNVYVAEKYFLRATELSYSTAFLDLAELYSDKSSPLYSQSVAFDYFYTAVEEGVPNALETLAKQFTLQERDWFVKNQRSGQIAYDLAVYYEKSNNLSEACEWFDTSFKRHQEEAFLKVIHCVKDKLFTEEKYQDHLDVVREWALFKGWDEDSLIGELYLNGIGVSEDASKAAKYFIQAHNNSSDKVAQYQLGNMYLEGIGVSRNYIEAIRMFELSAQQGVSAAYLSLGKIYQQGLGVDTDHTRAFELIKRAAIYNDDAKSAFEYANLLFEGVHNTKNIRLAIDWYDRAIHLKHDKASCKLGEVLAEHYIDNEEKIRSNQLLKYCVN